MKALNVTEANRAPMSFADAYAIPRWAVEAVKFVSGRTDSGGAALMGGAAGLFDPEGAFTIEQAIIALLRMHDSRSVENEYPGWRDAPGYNLVQIDLTFGGDCTFGRAHNFSYYRSFDEMYDLMGPDYFFSGIEEFFDDDLTMVNFEGTLTDAVSHVDKAYALKGRPEYAQILQAGSIDVVTVANNHSKDYFERGFQDTLQYLSPYVAVSGYERMPIVTVKGVDIGFASNVGWVFDESQKKFITNAVETLRAAGADLVVFNFHWGIEREYHSNATQRAIAHYCIDQGADLVIGHHPHVVQETETYKGKQIVYSLGNLVFGGNQNPTDKNCLIFRQTYIFDLDTLAVVSQTHSAIPYLVSSVTYRNDYHPVRAD
jgi:poly-gamma-glutamate synthesis protein (capsule biosynthesis protein)